MPGNAGSEIADAQRVETIDIRERGARCGEKTQLHRLRNARANSAKRQQRAGRQFGTMTDAVLGNRRLLCGLLHPHNSIDGGMLQALHNAAWPANLHVVDFLFAAQAKVGAAIA